MQKRPKRRKYKDNPYTLSVDNDTYKVTFIDSLNKNQIIEINKNIFETLDKFELEDLSEMNKYDRHIEHLALEDISYNRILYKNESVEDEVLKQIEYNELKLGILKLSEVQRRRLVLYFFYNLTLREIADIDNCSPRAVKDSIDISLQKLKKFIKFKF